MEIFSRWQARSGYRPRKPRLCGAQSTCLASTLRSCWRSGASARRSSSTDYDSLLSAQLHSSLRASATSMQRLRTTTPALSLHGFERTPVIHIPASFRIGRRFRLSHPGVITSVRRSNARPGEMLDPRQTHQSSVAADSRRARAYAPDQLRAPHCLELISICVTSQAVPAVGTSLPQQNTPRFGRRNLVSGPRS